MVMNDYTAVMLASMVVLVALLVVYLLTLINAVRLSQKL
jgi:hypothetical protein